MKKLSLLALAIVSVASAMLTGCANNQPYDHRGHVREYRNAHDLEELLAGSWVNPRDSNDYLFFGPELSDFTRGQFRGVDNYDYYVVTSRNPDMLSLGLRLTNYRSDNRVFGSVYIRFSEDQRYIMVTRDYKGADSLAPKHVYRRTWSNDRFSRLHFPLYRDRIQREDEARAGNSHYQYSYDRYNRRTGANHARTQQVVIRDNPMRRGSGWLWWKDYEKKPFVAHPEDNLRR